VKSPRQLVTRAIVQLVHTVQRAYFREHNRLYAERWHPHNALLEDALAETVDYIKTNMKQAMIRSDAYDVLTYASHQVALDGLYLEFGVRTGKTINHIARLNPAVTIYGFDSFEGLPENWSGWLQDKGTFAGEGIPEVDTNVRLVTGWFEESLPPFLADHEGQLALAHIDSDIYSSARTVLDNLAPRIQPGSIIVFNEYFNYPNWKEHEYKAFREFCEQHEVDYEYLCWGMYEVAVKILAIRDDG